MRINVKPTDEFCLSYNFPLVDKLSFPSFHGLCLRIETFDILKEFTHLENPETWYAEQNILDVKGFLRVFFFLKIQIQTRTGKTG